MINLPLDGLIVLEFSQYLSGPSAGLRLADLGARVIKIERPKVGDACRQLSIKNLWAPDGSSLLFHTINRNKESFVADLKNPDDISLIRKLIAKADVLTTNFRPGVMKKSGLDYASVKEINPRLIYAEITGYGNTGPWKDKPGQDLLLQSLSGLTYTSGTAGDPPVPFGIAIADIICGTHLVQGILAALIRRQKKNVGALIEVSLLESLIDFQFELFTTYFADQEKPLRSAANNGHPLLSAPYGLYQTTDGFIAIAMVPLSKLAKAIHSETLATYNQQEAFSKRDEIKEIISKHFISNSSAYWIKQLHTQGLWAIEVSDWNKMKDHDAYMELKMEQSLKLKNGDEIITTRCPIRINGERLVSTKPAPALGEHTQSISEELTQQN